MFRNKSLLSLKFAKPYVSLDIVIASRKGTVSDGDKRFQITRRTVGAGGRTRDRLLYACTVLDSNVMK